MVSSLGWGAAGAAVAGSAGAVGAAGTTGATAASSGLLVAKWIGIAVATGAIGLGAIGGTKLLRSPAIEGAGAWSASSSPTTGNDVRAQRSEAAPAVIPSAKSAPVSPEQAPRPLTRSRPPPVVRTAEAPAASSTEDTLARLAPQLELLEAARRALRAGKPAETRRLVGMYRKRFPNGDFDAEANALEAEAMR